MKAIELQAGGRSLRRPRGISESDTFPRGTRGRCQGYTLMELLVVITIIAILAAMSGPVYAAVMRKVRGVQAGQTATELEKAIATYKSDYRRLPLPRKSHSRGDLEVDSGADLMGVLLASDKERGPGGLNPRATPFFTGRQASDSKPPRNGVDYDAGGGGVLYDPWGQPYRLIFDADRDGRCDNPREPGRVVVRDVLVWSCGPNGEDDRGGEDDIAIW